MTEVIFLTIKQVAYELGYNVTTVRDHIHKNRLEAIRVGRAWMVTRSDLETFKQKYPREILKRRGNLSSIKDSPENKQNLN